MKPLSLLFLSAGLLCAQQDNFNDGDATGWLQQDAVSQAISMPNLEFTFPDGGYRIRSLFASPAPAQIGPSRGGALRADVTYTDDFYISVDINAYDRNLIQGFGIIAMVQPGFGLGNTNAYSFTLNPANQDVQISKITNDVPENEPFLSLEDVTETTADKLRMVFMGKGGEMTGLLFNYDDLENPIGVCQATDTSYTSGVAGLVISNFDLNRAGVADATFDNYRAQSTSLPELEIDVDTEGNFELTFPANWPFGVPFLETSTILDNEEIWDPLETVLEETLEVYEEKVTDSPDKQFFRLFVEPFSF